MKKIAISMTTIPRRMKFLAEICFPSIAKSVNVINNDIERDFNARITDFVLTIDKNYTDEVKESYKEWARTVNVPAMNITIQEAENDWCINKETGGLKFCKERSKEFSAFITVDDDIVFDDPKKFYDLVKYHSKFKDDVICVETNPVIKTQNGVSVVCGIPPKIAALRSYNKFLTNFCLFPIDCLDGTRIEDSDYIIKNEFYRHDELLVWAELTNKGVKSIVLPNTFSLALDHDIICDENGLYVYNSGHWNEWNAKINELYPNFKNLFEYEIWEYFIEDTNAYAIYLLSQSGVMNQLAEKYGKILEYNKDIIVSDSYRKLF